MLGGTWHGVPALAGRGRPEATWLATPASRRAAPAAPASSEVLGPERVHKGLWRLAPLHPTFPRGRSGLPAATVFSLVSPRLSGLGRTTLTPALSAAGGGGAPLQLCPPLASFPPGQGPPMGARSLRSPPRALTAFCVPCSRSPGAVLGLPQLGPRSGQGQSAGHYAKAAQEAPWVARWALTGPPQVPHLQAVTPKEQN